MTIDFTLIERAHLLPAKNSGKITATGITTVFTGECIFLGCLIFTNDTDQIDAEVYDDVVGAPLAHPKIIGSDGWGGLMRPFMRVKTRLVVDVTGTITGAAHVLVYFNDYDPLG